MVNTHTWRSVKPSNPLVHVRVRIYSPPLVFGMSVLLRSVRVCVPITQFFIDVCVFVCVCDLGASCRHAPWPSFGGLTKYTKLHKHTLTCVSTRPCDRHVFMFSY